MKKYIAFVLGIGLSTVSFAATNVALNAPVTLNGTFGVLGWGGPLAAGSTLTDGLFKAQNAQWDINTVWWNSRYANNTVQIDLGGPFSIDALTLQADNNDVYPVFYRNGAADSWHSTWNVPMEGNWGMDTRQVNLGSPIIATSFQIKNAQGDGYYSVSEFQAFGTAISSPVPEPETYAMLLVGLGLLGFTARRRKQSV